MLSTTTQPRIYVACLAAYNNGVLHGRWIDADISVDYIEKEIEEMLAESPANAYQSCEEWSIHDYEGFGQIKLKAYEKLETVYEIAVRCSNEETGHLFSHLYTYFVSIEEADEWLERYAGEYESLGSYAEYALIELGFFGEIPSQLQPYIDYESMARDWEINGSIFVWEQNYETFHVFSYIH